MKEQIVKCPECGKIAMSIEFKITIDQDFGQMCMCPKCKKWSYVEEWEIEEVNE